ncbi:MAG: ABC transporter substrate-binding protein, partial [Acidimicrobiia bacterium]|nr:ABC transporter substrate-binding protein [Acidimicrobiia bacterium]
AVGPSTSVAPESTSTTTTEPPTVSVGGTAALGIVGEPLSLNPLRTGGNAPVVEAISELWTIGLIGLDEKTHDPVAEAAAEIPTLENGGLALDDDGTMTVHYAMAPDARWDDGSPITGHDVAFTYDLIMDAALPIRPDLKALHSLIVPGSVEVSGSSITLVLERPTIRYLDLFPILVPAEQVADSDFIEDWNETTWMSAGPFRFDSWEDGRKIRFVRNNEYANVDHLGDRLPYLDSVEIAFFNGDDALLAAFRLQTVDAALIAADPAVLEELDASPAVDLQVSAGPEYEHLAFEYGPGRFGANPGSMNESVQFREFVARALDRRATVSEVLADRVPVLNTVVGMSWPAAASAGWAPYTADDAVQADLLESAMAEFESETITVSFTTSASLERTQIAGSFLQRLAAAGLSVDIELLEVGEFFKDRVLPGAFDIAEWAWRATPGPVGAVVDLKARFLTLPEDGGYNFYRWGAADSARSEVVADVQSKILELESTLDLGRLREQLEEIDTILAEHVVVLPMFAAPNAAAVWVASFEGFDHVAAFPDTWNAALWHRTDG